MTNFDFYCVEVSVENFLVGACKGTDWKVYSFRNKYVFEHVSDRNAVFSVIGDNISGIIEGLEVIADDFASDSVNNLIDAIVCFDPCV